MRGNASLGKGTRNASAGGNKCLRGSCGNHAVNETELDEVPAFYFRVRCFKVLVDVVDYKWGCKPSEALRYFGRFLGCFILFISRKGKKTCRLGDKEKASLVSDHVSLSVHSIAGTGEERM